MTEHVVAIGPREYIIATESADEELRVRWSVHSSLSDGRKMLIADGRAEDSETAFWIAREAAEYDGADPYDHLPLS